MGAAPSLCIQPYP